MNKKYVIIVIVITILFLAFAFLGFHYHDQIEKIVEGDIWSYIDSYTEIDSEQSLACFGRKFLCVCTKEDFKIYNNSTMQSKKSTTISDFLYNSNGIYSVLYIDDSKQFILVKNNEIIHSQNLDVIPKSIYVDKNGYVILLYSQIGYKTGIKVYKQDGEEILATYLANSYATCAQMSENDKYLYIGEVDSSGIKVKSKIKCIDCISREANDIELPLGGVIVDIKSHNNNILVKTDIGIYEVNSLNKNANLLVEYEKERVINAYVDGDNKAIVIKENDDPTNDYEIVFYGNDSTESVAFSEFPQDIDIYENTVALNFGNEIWIIKNGHLRNKISINEALTGMNIFSDGKEIALMFRNSIRVVKI